MLDAVMHVGDTGTEIVVAVTDEAGAIVDISTATVLTIYLTRPDRITLTKTGVLDSTGTDGLFKYVTVASDLSQTGTWRIQGFVTVNGKSWSTREGDFEVFKSRHG